MLSSVMRMALNVTMLPPTASFLKQDAHAMIESKTTNPFREQASDMTHSIIKILAHKEDKFIRIMRKIEKLAMFAYEKGVQDGGQI
jgi:hypothetical protein